MSEAMMVFDHALCFDPDWDFEAFLRAAPARWAVYLLADADDRPVQLLCVKNLRSSLKRRLGGDELVGPSRRVRYRELVRRVHWRRVDSTLEADWIYYEAARQLFPETYRGMVGFRPAWFVHVDPEAEFPRYVKTNSIGNWPGLFVGPVEDKHAAARLVEVVEDAFDLCRFYNILVQSPNARPCAYKEMGKCPAPCDGSISLTQYRWLVQWSARVLIDPAEAVREQETRMAAAAGELRFETAAKIKQFIAQLSLFGKGSFRHAARLEDFVFVAIQHGPREGTAKVFLITPGRIEEILGIVSELQNPGAVLRTALERLSELDATRVIDAEGAERLGIVAHHLFAPKTRGVLLRMDAIDEKAIAKGYRQMLKQARAEEDEDEGVMKELQTL